MIPTIHHIAGQRWLKAKLRSSKGSFNYSSAVHQYLKKNGYEGTLTLNPGLFGEVVHNRIALAQAMHNEFSAGIEFAWDEHYKAKHPASE